MINIELTEWERTLLNYYLLKFNCKWVRVFDNKHPFLDTRVDLYTIYKRKIKCQPVCGQQTFSNMFEKLEEGKWYFIPDLLKEGEMLIEEKSKK